jgi:hypothetical protein
LSLSSILVVVIYTCVGYHVVVPHTYLSLMDVAVLDLCRCPPCTSLPAI